MTDPSTTRPPDLPPEEYPSGLPSRIVRGILLGLSGFFLIILFPFFIRVVAETLYRMTEPMLRPIRRLMPNLGGVDISPVILLLGLFFLREALRYYVWPHFY